MTSTLEHAPASADSASPSAPRRPRPPLAILIGLTAGLGAILALLLAIFILPSLKSGAHDLSVGMTGPWESASRFEGALAASAPDAFVVHHYDSESALVEAVRSRDVAGGFVVGQDSVHSVVASAGSTAIASTISATARTIGAAMGVAVTTADVVALPSSDPSGIGIGGLAFPLVFGGIVPVVAFRSVFERSKAWRLAGLLAFSVVGGLIVAAVLRFGFGSIESAFWAVAAAMSLGIAAMAFPLSGLQHAFGGKGFTIGAMAMMFLGNPFAGMATTAAWLPAGLGAFGQILPPGATGTLVRSVAYFGGAGGLTAGLTLGAWVLGGLVIHGVGSWREGRPAKVAAPGRLAIA